MAIGVQRPAPPPQPVQNNDGKKGKDKWSKGLTLAGLVAGGVGGAIAGGPMGAAGGASTGAGLGGLVGGMVDTKPKDPTISYIQQGPQPIEKTESSISRRLASQQGDSLMSLANGLQAVGRSPVEIQKEYGPPIFQAYMAEYNKRKGVV